MMRTTLGSVPEDPSVWQVSHQASHCRPHPIAPAMRAGVAVPRDRCASHVRFGLDTLRASSIMVSSLVSLIAWSREPSAAPLPTVGASQRKRDIY
eukprot:5287363-Amphidinium_carterae.1